ncbi:hypothetical protein SmJEL517_g06242 [Synchytrium microbalum]|uniref:Translation initiation factor IF2/IF5 domain-containing protein n=1 Tax=Synchytrium microbalum TaxID=1806994 RepID=A0A507BQK6_9FUNG|nr:uncharacterized protein SmJEL517_g06242 [Synchytrium microbalum]TPX30122.1 hypothetical protein SmJEL517_g06242 [Synchytrium microbalum]
MPDADALATSADPTIKKKKKAPNFDEPTASATSQDIPSADIKPKKKKKSTATDDTPAAEDATPTAVDDEFAGLKKKSKKPKADAITAADGEAVASEAAAAADDFSGLKKKKKKVKAEEGTDAAAAPSDAVPADDFDFGKKKKKKRPDIKDFEKQEEGADHEEDGAHAAGEASAAVDEDGGAEEIQIGEAPAEESSILKDVGETWLGTDRDYSYPELLSRVFRIIRQNNPELAGEKKRYTIAPPQVAREGTKKTVFANVADIARRMRRTPDHLVQYLFAELGTTGSVDGQERLVIKGKFVQKQIETVLKRYIVEYVTCRNCKSADTNLSKDNRLFFLNCQSCGSSRSVSAIKTGFVAQTGKRAAQRAATQP